MNFIDPIVVMSEIHWREPLWMSLLFVPWLLQGSRWLLHSRHHHYADHHLMPWVMLAQDRSIVRRFFSKKSAYLFAWLLFAVVASGPRIPIELGAQQQTTDMDIMLIVDVSRSMRAMDVYPNRLRRAQIEIEELLERAESKRIGIIVFAGQAHVLVPLTSDYSALRFYLRLLSTLVLPTHGSNVQAALTMARQELQHAENPAAIILLSDGDFSENIQLSGTAKISPTIPLYALGIGTVAGEAIQLENGEWLEYENKSVISYLQETNLRNFTGSSEKNYTQAEDDDSDWQFLYNAVISGRVQSSDVDTQGQIVWRELYHWPLMAAILLLWFSLMPYQLKLNLSGILGVVREFGHRINLWSARLTKTSKALCVYSIVVLSNFTPSQELLAVNFTVDSKDSPIDSRGALVLYHAEQYSDALAMFEKLKGYSARFGEASSRYKLQDYHGAIRQYSRAVISANNDNQRAAALFNLGNSYFKMGNYAVAIAVYGDALLYRPGHKNTVYNINFSKALKKRVDEQLIINPPAARMGSGTQSSEAGEIDVNPAGSISVIESVTAEHDKVFIPESPTNSNTDLESLIEKGLQYAKLAAENDAVRNLRGVEDIIQTNKKLKFANARIRMMEIDDQQSLLWKQLFEIEEGYPAPLNQPRPLPGVRPW